MSDDDKGHDWVRLPGMKRAACLKCGHTHPDPMRCRGPQPPRVQRSPDPGQRWPARSR
jgi:hypothetical protein